MSNTPPVGLSVAGELSDEQSKAFSTFKENLTKLGVLGPSNSSQSTGPTSIATFTDDTTLLRFLRARSYDVSGAQTQYLSSLEWRKKHDVERLFATFPADEFDRSRSFYPRWTGRRDRNGVPLYVYHLASLKPFQKEITATPIERRYQRIICLYESLTRFALPLCSALPHPSSPVPISASSSIIDLKDASLSSLWALRSHLQESASLATANYPETLHLIVIVNSPSFFPTIWGWIKGWFDEGTRNKIYVLGAIDHTSIATLRSLVSPEDLPKIYGGELEWSFYDEPNLDEDTKIIIGDKVPSGPVVLIDGKVAPAPIPMPT